MMDYRDNVQNCQDYINALEEEQRKIQVFQRELPLCLQLVTQTIEAYRQQLSGTTTATTGECFNGGEAAAKHQQQQESECSEQTTGDGGPIFEEFMPINRTSSSADNEHNDDDELESHKSKIRKMLQDNGNNINDNDKSGMKSDWLRSAQLWNQTTADPPSTTVNKEEQHHNPQPKKVLVVEAKRNGGGAFQPFQKHKTSGTATVGGASTSKPTSAPAASACSTADEAPASSGGVRTGDANASGSSGGKKDEKDGGQRKTRRCWSPELHRRFLNALQQLGGSHVATPKQIRDLMKVDGLTNDEVKSHLQKYRLHTRRPTPSVHHNSTNTAQPQQFVIVGGIWVPPPEYAAAAATTLGETTLVSAAVAAPASNGRIYAPIATTPQQRPVATESTAAATTAIQYSQGQEKMQSCSDERGRSHSEGGRVRSNSPASSSSTHTTTASPAF